MSNLKLKNLPKNSLPRERMIEFGVSSLSDYELIAILLEKGIKEKNVLDLSKELLSSYNLLQLSKLSPHKLSKIPGIGIAKSCRIIASFELANRLSSYHNFENPKINSPEDVYHLLNYLKYKNKEILLGLFLDSKKQLISKKTIFIGILDATLIHPREIFSAAISSAAASIILVHNHPSGDPMPSLEDIKITKQLIIAGKIIGIPILDHIIIGNNKFISLKERNKI
ncbi:DNA repair protein RadC [archaeon]|jgi:DNA repair protein RadC|nr:DNA repair protein RadC [archaeon]MBT4022362.1 DNA repair protein RadC [archaeon]MBT4273240.1 DNA repair protein RadC [archaeon]MBT4461317.1 DNA repair protein RadC [archaeon]MBT4858674.1 DNA repair protein RadC [archaeon]